MAKTNMICVFLFYFFFSYIRHEISCESAVMYMGCYEDRRLYNTQINVELEVYLRMTPTYCNEHCFQRGFTFAGTTNGFSCFCSRTKPPENQKVEESKCDTVCSGDRSKICGGSTRLSVFATATPESDTAGRVQRSQLSRLWSVLTTTISRPFIRITHFNSNDDDITSWSSIGCFADSGIQNFPHHRNIQGSFTNQLCINHCSKEGYHYAGTKNGYNLSLLRPLRRTQCFCSNEEPSRDLKVGQELCNMACEGNRRKACGGQWRSSTHMSWWTSVSSTNITLVTPVTTTVNTTANSCDPSETIVSGKTVCKGEVIFEDNFDFPSDEKWGHAVMIADKPELGYVVFNTDKENSFTINSKLVIKPTLFNNSFVTSGFLYLTSCTGKAGTKQCGYCATTDNILPPVKSARIHTKDSFSFRYGKVEIRAKLPLGDWIVPELWLEPKSHSYGQDFASGRIRVAMHRGNEDFTCYENDFGARFLESGVVMSPSNNLNNVRRRSITTSLPDNWHENFHNYTLTWTPGSISFQVDDEEPHQLVDSKYTGKKLCEVIGFKDECNSGNVPWSSGSMIAPFDKDFYISLGLSVGNAMDFPDDCTNKGNPKPWRNSDEKAVLKFWQDRENWQSTWSDEDSSLYIESIRVTAL